MIKYFFSFSFTFFLFTFLFSQEKKNADTLFILTDYVRDNNMFVSIQSNIKIKLREEKDTVRNPLNSKEFYSYKIPAIKIVPKNSKIKDLLSKNELNSFPIGVQKNICFVDKRTKERNKCDIKAGIYFIHKDIDFQYLEDYNSYLDVRDAVKADKKWASTTVPDSTPRNTYGKKIMNLAVIKTKYNYSDLSEFTKKTFFFSVAGIVHLVKKYKVIYIESERLDSNNIVFEKVDYQYYVDDVFP